MRTKPTKRAPGRPRSVKIQRAILTATSSLIKDHGVPGVTIEAVAAAAGVGKPTIYRYWANAHELTMSALIDASPATTVATPTDALATLRLLLHGVTATFSSPTGRHVALVLASADESSEIAKAFRSHFIQSRRKDAEDCLVNAVAAGTLEPDTPVTIILDMIFGAVIYRLLMVHAPIDPPFMDQLMETALTSFTIKVTRP